MAPHSVSLRNAGPALTEFLECRTYQNLQNNITRCEEPRHPQSGFSHAPWALALSACSSLGKEKWQEANAGDSSRLSPSDHSGHKYAEWGSPR